MSAPEYPTSAAIVDMLKAEGRPVFLAFSRGKDSLACWLVLREAGVPVIPVHLTLVPRLRFVAESIAFYREWFGTRIVELPHPSFYRWLNALMFQPPERCQVIESCDLPEPDYDELNDMLRADHKLPQAWVCDGVRAADSPNRRMAMTTYGPVKWNTRRVSPIWDWRIADIRGTLAKHACPLPVDYDWFGRSFDGLDHRFLAPLREHAPDDYARILDWFPLADLEFFRRNLSVGWPP